MIVLIAVVYLWCPNCINLIYLFLESQSEVIELLKQLNEKDEEIEQLKQSKLVYKRPIRQRLDEVRFQMKIIIIKFI